VTPGPVPPRPAARSGGRAVAAACGGLVVAAGLLWGASALAWVSPGQPPDGSGAPVAGAGTAPSALTGVALLALAGVAALVATSGVPRRIVGGLLGVVGGVVVVATAAAVLAVSVAVGVGPLLAVCGGLLLAVVGSAVLLREPQLRRLSARYAAAGSPSAHADPDRAAWAALDEGRDPTSEPPADPAVARPADPAADRAANGAACRAADRAPHRGAGRLVDQATASGTDATAEPDDPGGGRGGGPV